MPRIQGSRRHLQRSSASDFWARPPWQVLDGLGGIRLTSEPADLYSDVLVAIDGARGINNGEPQLWAFIFDRLDVQEGARVLHVGAGTGYYTALLAELAGPGGSVVAMEVEVDVAERARHNLQNCQQVEVRNQDAASLTQLPFDRIVFSCGITSLPPVWLDRLGMEARIAVPFTGTDGTGLFFSLTWTQEVIAVVPLSGVVIYPAAGFRDAREERQIDGVSHANPQALWQVRSLRPLADVPPSERIYGFSGHAMRGPARS